MEKINVKICVGTMCYVMGGAELRDVIESLPQNILEHLNVSYSPCLGCGKGASGRADVSHPAVRHGV